MPTTKNRSYPYPENTGVTPAIPAHMQAFLDPIDTDVSDLLARLAVAEEITKSISESYHVAEPGYVGGARIIRIRDYVIGQFEVQRTGGDIVLGGYSSTPIVRGLPLPRPYPQPATNTVMHGFVHSNAYSDSITHWSLRISNAGALEMQARFQSRTLNNINWYAGFFFYHSQR